MTNPELLEKAKKIQKNIITIDTHDDIDVKNFTSTRNYSSDINTQVNLPKMRKGGLDVAWLVVYTSQGKLDANGYKQAYVQAMAKFQAIHRLITEYAPGEICLATTPEQVRELVKEGRLVAMIGVENGYALGENLENIQKFYDLGARYMSLAHNGNNQLSDSHTSDDNKNYFNHGLSELGKKAISEMNRLGIMIDVSHPSKEAIKQMFQLSKSPLIASHSSARRLSDTSRNLDDELLKLFNKHGGVVQAVAYTTFVNKNKHYSFEAAKAEIYRNEAKKMDFEIHDKVSIEKMTEEEKTNYAHLYQEMKVAAASKVENLRQKAAVNVQDFVDQIDYLVKKIGINHVGISSDFDGGGGIVGWKDASQSLNVTIELLKRGYSEEEIAKLWGENLLRVMDEVQAIARKIQDESNKKL